MRIRYDQIHPRLSEALGEMGKAFLGHNRPSGIYTDPDGAPVLGVQADEEGVTIRCPAVESLVSRAMHFVSSGLPEQQSGDHRE